MLKYPQSKMFDSKRLLGHKFSNKYIQEIFKITLLKILKMKKQKN